MLFHKSKQVQVANKEALKGTETNDAIADMTKSVNEVANEVQDITNSYNRQLDECITTKESQEVAAIAEETSKWYGRGFPQLFKSRQQ
ncbi:hypothetical protein KHA80_11270 [Anaerobacillus sp. HL2]|nr:hypothetical protein KHA80_11270 [Anaerobacillus sp. HL2]